MIRRWLIRGLALTLLTLCVGAWVGSYWRAVTIERRNSSGVQAAIIEWGAVGIVSIDGKIDPQWHWNVNPARKSLSHVSYWRWYWSMGNGNTLFLFLGFHYNRHHGFGQGGRLENDVSITMPLWFLALHSALLLWLVWGRATAKPVGGAFPVEATATATKS